MFLWRSISKILSKTKKTSSWMILKSYWRKKWRTWPWVIWQYLTRWKEMLESREEGITKQEKIADRFQFLAIRAKVELSWASVFNYKSRWECSNFRATWCVREVFCFFFWSGWMADPRLLQFHLLWSCDDYTKQSFSSENFW